MEKRISNIGIVMLISQLDAGTIYQEKQKKKKKNICNIVELIHLRIDS